MEKKQIDIEKILCPQKNKLRVKGDAILTKIVDAELDVINCEFGNDGTVTIHTEDLTYITLSYQNLYDLTDLLDRAEEMYDKRFNK
jgi:hypothetical protein